MICEECGKRLTNKDAYGHDCEVSTRVKKRKCPVCKKYYTKYPALSRRDNKTYICPDCGVREAFEDFARARSKARKILR